MGKNLWSASVEFKMKAWQGTNSRNINTLQPETTTKRWQKAVMLETNVSSSHAVSQFVPVSKEGHEAHVSLDWDVLIQDQDAIGLPRNWLHGMGLLGGIPELLTKFLDLWARRRERREENTHFLFPALGNECCVCSFLLLMWISKVSFIFFCRNKYM